jgi:murein DD-endopeptidase MepM/ murein hydrolase activator NlpD
LRALLVALAVLAAAPSPAPPVSGLDRDNVVTVYQWLQVLPAPPTPPGWRPPAPAFAFPLSSYVETQPFGCTNFALEGATTACPGGFHTGIDLADPEGTPIRAAGPGLAYPFQDSLRYGNHVLILHPGGYSTVYGHMVRTAVAWGQPVDTGDVIGFVGSTGNSTGPHLHFEVRFAGVAQDPMLFLTGDPAQPFPIPAGWQGSPPDDPWGPG